MGNYCCTNRDRLPMTNHEIKLLTTSQLSLNEVDKSLKYIKCYFEGSKLLISCNKVPVW